MKEEIIIAGFGGQGVLSMGKILAYAAVMENKEVTWMPSYGPEMRGGTANVTVIINDDKISSPIVQEYDTAIILNQQSLEKFEPCVKKGGVLIYDINGLSTLPTRKDISVYEINAVTAALEVGNSKIFNMVILGAYISIVPTVKMTSIMESLRHSLPERAHHLLPLNEKALHKGKEVCVKK